METSNKSPTSTRQSEELEVPQGRRVCLGSERPTLTLNHAILGCECPCAAVTTYTLMGRMLLFSITGRSVTAEGVTLFPYSTD
ncbi:hypothetical protein EVAR_68809_1 [Eumeta japonica]|uniref:Uncharacterized protein n=1 Tax=Eumeta variegata TaxID=151549 RepID=A0A4C1YY16_EUMVA|nr:hypothetical protein EVAR_68809_1 [Eumeta japonica]